jgi:membrane protease YdiL (CAAX protease family)
VKPMTVRTTVPYALAPAALLFAAIRIAIPLVRDATGWKPLLCWYLCGGLLVFVPLFIAAFVLVRRETAGGVRPDWIGRFRLSKPSRGTVAWSLGGTLAVLVLTGLFMAAGKRWIPGFSAAPPFLRVDPLGPGEKWILAAWLPLFFFNIAGEGLYWRGTVFPRQQAAYGERAWILQGLTWTVFHLPFGWSLVFLLFPILFITPWIVSRTRSTWPDLIIHAIVNGSGFLLVAFGAVR